MPAYAVVDNDTGSVLKWGFVDFTGEIDPLSQSIVELNLASRPVPGVYLYFQKIVAGNFVEMSTSEKDAVEAQGIAPNRDTAIVYGACGAFKTGDTNYSAFYSSLCTGQALDFDSLLPNVIYAMPIVLPQRMAIDRIAIDVEVADTGTARLGIYNDKNGYPTRLIKDWGETDVSTVGNKKLAGTKIIRAGLKWLVIVSNAQPSIRTFTRDHIIPTLGWLAALPAGPTIGFYAPFTYAAFPDEFPTGVTPLTSSPFPAIFVRFAEF